MRAAPPPGASPDRAGAVVGHGRGAGHEAPPPGARSGPSGTGDGNGVAVPRATGHAAEPKNAMPSPGGLKVNTPPSEATIQYPSYELLFIPPTTGLLRVRLPVDP